jgi:hypothetical protein
MIEASRIKVTRSTWFRRSGLIAGVSLLAAFVAYSDRAEKRPQADLAAANCKAWDEEAASGISALLPDSSGAAEIKLNEALAQLRRARLYCRSGSVSVARHDYESLHRAFPVATGSIRKSPDSPATLPTKISLPQ